MINKMDLGKEVDRFIGIEKKI